MEGNDITPELDEEDTLSGDSDDEVAPSKTTRQPTTEVKRAAKVTGDAKYKKLKEALGKTPVVGQGYAIKISMYQQFSVPNLPSYHPRCIVQ